MSDSSFALIGDVHLERLRTILPGDSIGLQLQALRSVLERCRALRVRRVIFGGDIFDTAHPEDETKLRLADLFFEFRDIKIYLLSGNHDRPLLAKHSLKLLDWIGQRQTLNLEVILTPTLKRFGSHRVWLCPHPYIQDQPRSASCSIGHFPWRGARRDNGSVEPQGSMPKGEWLLADFHTPQAGKHYQYAGSLTQISWQESQEKSWLLIRLRDRLEVKPQAITLPYTLNTLEICDPKDLEQIHNSQAHAYYRIIVHPGVQLPADWQKRYPTIIRRDPIKVESGSKQILARVQLAEDPFAGVKDWLRDRGKLTERQIKWAAGYLERLNTHD